MKKTKKKEKFFEKRKPKYANIQEKEKSNKEQIIERRKRPPIDTKYLQITLHFLSSCDSFLPFCQKIELSSYIYLFVLEDLISVGLNHCIFKILWF